MKISSQVNYAVISNKSVFLRNIVVKYIVELNELDKVYVNPSLFGKRLFISDDKIPSDNFFVISFKKRLDFVTLDLDTDPLDCLCQVLGVENSKFKVFVRSRVFRKFKRDSLYFYMLLLKGCILDDGDFNYTQANILLSNNQFSVGFSLYECYLCLNNYVIDPSVHTIYELVRVFGSNSDVKLRFRLLINCISSIISDTVPSYVKSKLEFLNSRLILMRYLHLSIAVSLSDDYDTFISHLISKL